MAQQRTSGAGATGGGLTGPAVVLPVVLLMPLLAAAGPVPLRVADRPAVTTGKRLARLASTVACASR